MSTLAVLFASMIVAGPPGPGSGSPSWDHDFYAESTCSGDPSIEFVSPLDGEMVESPFTVEFIARTACNCDTGGCFDGPLSNIGVTANGQFFAATDQTVMVSLPAGEHELTLSGEAAFHSEFATITVTVIGGDGGTSGGGDNGEGGKCAVHEPAPEDLGGAGLLLGLLGLFGLRRRRTRRPALAETRAR